LLCSVLTSLWCCGVSCGWSLEPGLEVEFFKLGGLPTGRTYLGAKLTVTTIKYYVGQPTVYIFTGQLLQF
jgi:hypothetical protein